MLFYGSVSVKICQTETFIQSKICSAMILEGLAATLGALVGAASQRRWSSVVCGTSSVRLGKYVIQYVVFDNDQQAKLVVSWSRGVLVGTPGV